MIIEASPLDQMLKVTLKQFTPGLKTKLQISFLLIVLLAITVTGWQAFVNARSALETITFDKLTSIRETKGRQIEAYFQQIRNQALTLSEDQMMIDASENFTGVFNKIGYSAFCDEILTALKLPLETRNNAVNEYSQMHLRIDPILRNYLRRFGYDDIFIVEPSSGVIVYSVQKKTDFGQSLLEHPFDSTNIAAAFNDARRASQPYYVKFVDFAPYRSSRMIPASFVASPIFDGHKIVGVLIFQISINLINRVMTSDNNWKAEGLEETGETYIVGEDFRMRTDSRFFIQEPHEYFQRLLKIGTDSSIIQKIKSQATSILIQEVRTTATIEALQGKTNTKIIGDYRSIPVLSSYTLLKIPDVHWVILAEIDVSEAFGSVFILRERLILLGLIILLIAALVVEVISRTISSPILSLAKATEKFGKGDLTFRAKVESDDEIGLLARTFNRMTESIMQNTVHLQREIVERKRAEDEVKLSRERLRNLSGHLQTVREEERKGIAREIHDELGQSLTTLKLNLALLKERFGPDDQESLRKVSSMVELIDATIKSVKRMITALRPRLLDDLGLPAAIEWQVGEFQDRTGISCTLLIHPEHIDLDSDRSTAIFRILQETLTNILRHADAKKVSVNLIDRGETLELSVSDDGRGITDEQLNDPRSFGLIGIRERAYYWGGTVDIQGVQNQGTSIKVRLPIEERVSL
ncbi:MAG: histidine kinase [Bacteroidota bacterium]